MAKKMTREEDEYNRLIKILDFRLLYKFNKIGYYGALLLFVLLLGDKFLNDNSLTLLAKDVIRTFILLFLLTASLSKDSFEDEFNRHIRFQSYVLAFVCATVYTILLPLVAMIMDIIITKITGDGMINFHEVSSFEILFILIGLQLLFFETIKKLGRA
jgi:hypothetical protein